jgi:hypothetical protein
MALHFVGFNADREWRAVAIWGQPDFWHRTWDWRARQEIAPGDVAVFANGDEFTTPHAQGHDDSSVRCSWCRCGPGECTLRDGR